MGSVDPCRTSYGWEDDVQILLEKVGGTGVPWRVKVEHGMI